MFIITYETVINGITLIEHGAMYVAAASSTVFFCYRMVRGEVYKTKQEGNVLREAAQTYVAPAKVEQEANKIL